MAGQEVRCEPRYRPIATGDDRHDPFTKTNGTQVNFRTDPVIPDEVARQARDLGPLESPLIWWTLAASTVVLVTVVVCFRRRRTLRRRAAIAAACCCLLAAVTAVNTYVGYVRTFHDLGRVLERGSSPLSAVGRVLDDGRSTPARSDSSGEPAPTGDLAPKPADSRTRIERIDIADPASGVPSGRSFVILPPGYSDPGNAARYPVVFLIHGYPYGGPEDWLTSGDATHTLQLMFDTKAISPMIVVSVDMTAGEPSRDWEALDVPGGPQLETYLAKTVVPRIDQHYRTVADRGARALGGMSGGGYGALNIGLHHVDEFGSLLISLPYDTLGDEVRLFRGDRRLIEANTPRDYLPTMTFSAPVAVMLAVGSGAVTDVTTAKRIAGAFKARGQEATVHSERGFNHTWHTARATLPYLLVFADQHFRGSSQLTAVTH